MSEDFQKHSVSVPRIFKVVGKMTHKIEFIDVTNSEKKRFSITVIYSAINLYFKVSDIFYFLNLKEWSIFTNMYVSDLKFFSDFHLPNQRMDVATLFIPVNSLFMLLRLLKCGQDYDLKKHRELITFLNYIDARWKTVLEASVNSVVAKMENPLDLSKFGQNDACSSKNAEPQSSKN